MKGIIAAFILSIAAAGAADAARFNFVANDSVFDVAWGVITTSDTLNAAGGYDITAVSGDTLSGPIVGLIANPAQPDTGYYFPDGHVSTTNDFGSEWYFDNVLFTDGGAWFSENGLLFQSASVVYNFATYLGQDYIGVSGVGTWSATEWYGTFALSPAAAPEPASWAMMVAGFGLAGAALRRRRTTLRFA